MNVDMTTIIFAVANVMSCDRCPYPCKAKEHSSPANCFYHWYDILASMEKEPVEDVKAGLFDMYCEEFNREDRT